MDVLTSSSNKGAAASEITYSSYQQNINNTTTESKNNYANHINKQNSKLDRTLSLEK